MRPLEQSLMLKSSKTWMCRRDVTTRVKDCNVVNRTGTSSAEKRMTETMVIFITKVRFIQNCVCSD